MIMATWNIQGIRSKWMDIMKAIDTMKIDLIVLTETKKKGSGIEKKGEFIHIYSGVKKEERTKRGVSVLMNKKFGRNLKNFETIDERILKINMDIFGRRITILGIYAPNNDENIDVKNRFYQKLQEITDEIGGTREIIMMGDFNGRTGCRKGDDVVGEFGEDMVNDNGERLIEYCISNDLKIANGFFKHKDIHKYTWYQHTRQLKTIIDYVIIKQKPNVKLLDVRVQRGAECGSDHFMVRARIAFPYSTNSVGEERNSVEMEDIDVPDYNLEGLTEESTERLFQMRLDEKLEERHHDSANELYQHIKSSLHQAANEALGQKRKGRIAKNFWWDEEIDKIIQKKKEAYIRWMSSKKEEDRQIYRTLRKDTRKLVLEKKRTSWDKKCREIETYIGGRRCTEAWKFLRNIRKEGNNSWHGISVKKWEEYYKALLTERRDEFQMINTDIDIIEEPVQLSMENVKLATKKLKNFRASGPGGIPAELIKSGTNKLFRLITQLFEMCLNGEETPEEWKTGYLTSIYKKGDRQKCENYRGITVTATFSRLYGRILKELIEEEIKTRESEEQSGFRAGRSCMDNIFCLKQIIEKEISVRNQIHLVFIDLTKAYDNVPIAKLWNVLKEMKINQNIIRAIQELYRQSKTKIKIGKKVSKGFVVDKGLRQGCCISPTLFKIYVEEALKRWKESCRGMGIKMNERSIFTLQFADDQVIVAKNKNDLENMTIKIKEEYEKWGLYMNVSKTKYLCIGGNETELNMNNNMKIDSCEHYRYLGVDINKQGSDRQEIKHRICQGRKAIKLLNSVWWSEEISRTRKYNIYNSIVKSILLYGAEGWRIMEAEKKKLAAVEMDALRRSCRVSRIERIRNDRIKEMMKIKKTILDDLQEKQLIWYGHVKRMSEERLPKIAFNFKSNQKRPRGRPRKKWMDDIRDAMKQRHLKEEWALNRDVWRSLL